MPAIDSWDIAQGTPDPMGEDQPDYAEVSRLVHLHLAAAATQAKAKEQAVRFAGQQEFQDLVNGGATPEEALRRTAHKLYYNNPEHMIAALRLNQAKKDLPLETVERNGQTYYRTGPNSFAHVPQPNPNSPNAIPLDARQQMKTADESVARKNRDLTAAQKDYRKALESTNPEDQRVAQEALTKARTELDAAEGNRLYASTNWQSRASAPALPPALAERVASAPPAKAPLLTSIGPKGLVMSRNPADLAQIGEQVPGEEVATEDSGVPPVAPDAAAGGFGSLPSAAAALSPFKEGQLIRNKKNGKLYKVVNGEPVEQGDATEER